jgi:integrase
MSDNRSLSVPTSPGALARLQAEAAAAAAQDYAGQALSASTLRAYRSDWSQFRIWCGSCGLVALPAEPATVAGYLAAMALAHSRATLRRRLVAIGQVHRMAGHAWSASHPAIRNTLRGILRRHGAPARQAAALTTVDIRRLVSTCDASLAGLRDRALLLLGYAGALRRAELVGIAREDIQIEAQGIRLLIPRAKGDQEGEGARLGIARGQHRDTCPVRALEAWLDQSDCKFGPVFRKVTMWGRVEHTALHPDAVRQILRRRAEAAGLMVGEGERLSPHGLRAGFVTEAYRAGARDEEIMDHTRHRDLKTMRGYVRRAKLVTESPVRLLGL